jgi:hypothetical protein
LVVALTPIPLGGDLADLRAASIYVRTSHTFFSGVPDEITARYATGTDVVVIPLLEKRNKKSHRTCALWPSDSSVVLRYTDIIGSRAHRRAALAKWPDECVLRDERPGVQSSTWLPQCTRMAERVNRRSKLARYPARRIATATKFNNNWETVFAFLIPLLNFYRLRYSNFRHLTGPSQ